MDLVCKLFEELVKTLIFKNFKETWNLNKKFLKI